jgi:hypothetical protein
MNDQPHYRVLANNEIIQPGDQLLDYDAESWITMQPPIWLLGEKYNPVEMQPFRRRINPPSKACIKKIQTNGITSVWSESPTGKQFACDPNHYLYFHSQQDAQKELDSIPQDNQTEPAWIHWD